MSSSFTGNCSSDRLPSNSQIHWAEDKHRSSPGKPTLWVMRHDICFPLYIEVDEIYNLACPASPIHYQFDPVQTTKTSVHGSINMLGLAKRVKAKILLASTSEVYGDPTVHPQREYDWGNVNPIGLRSCYDEGKRCAETLFSLKRQYINTLKFRPLREYKDNLLIINDFEFFWFLLRIHKPLKNITLHS